MNRGGFRGGADAEPVAVLQAAIQQLVQREQPAAAQDKHAHEQRPKREVPQFIPAASFQGAKQGYFFSTGDEGTGYYRDEQQQLEPEAAVQRPQHDAQELLRQAEEQAQAAEVQLIDDKSLRKMLNTFEKKAKENLELRMKYADEPMKFLENEVDLLSLIRGLAQVAADPNSLYPILIDSPAVSTLSGLLSHDNTDIAVEVMDLLQELTDADEEEDNEAVAGSLIDALVESNALELLVERLMKLNEAVDEEAGAVNNALAIIEHAVELRPHLAEAILQRTKLLKWLLGRIRVKASDSNKQYASEILSILMQGHESNQALLGKANGVDTLLVCLAGFKSKEPADDLEQETMENLFDTLCSCLLLPANRQSFFECEGVQLMHLLLKGKKSSRYGAIKAIDFATTRFPAACDKLVEAGALAQLFAIFMGRSKIKNSKGETGDRDVVKEVEERCVSIISNLFQGVTKTTRKERLAAKFVEAEFEKVDRLMEVTFRYEAAVSAVEARLAEEAELLGEDLDEDELLLERLDAGLFTLQCCMVVIAALWSTGDVGLRKRLLGSLHQRGQSLEMVRAYLREYYFSLGDEGAPEERQRQLQRLSQLLAGLGVDIAAEAAERDAGAAAAAADEGAAAAAAGQEQADGTAVGAAEADGAADMDLDEDQPPPLPPDEEPASTQKQQQQQRVEEQQGAEQQQGNGLSKQQQQQQQQQQRVSPPPDKQQQQQQEAAAAEEPKQRSSSDRQKQRGEEQEQRDRERERQRDRDKERERERDKEGERGRDRDRERERDNEREHDRGDKERERERERERDKERERERDRDRDRRQRDRDREKQDSRSRRRSRSRSRSPYGRRHDRKSSKQKRRHRSRSDSRSR